MIFLIVIFVCLDVYLLLYGAPLLIVCVVVVVICVIVGGGGGGGGSDGDGNDKNSYR